MAEAGAGAVDWERVLEVHRGAAPGYRYTFIFSWSVSTGGGVERVIGTS